MDISKLGIRKAPWSWKVNESSKSISLHSHGNGGYKVMDFVRWSMQSAQPRFCEPDGIMHEGLELSVEIEGQEHNAAWNKTIKNNEAQLIATAPEMLEALIDILMMFQSIVPTSENTKYFVEYQNEFLDQYSLQIKAVEKAINKSWEEIKELLK